MSRTPWQRFADKLARLVAPESAKDLVSEPLTVEDLPDLLLLVKDTLTAAASESRAYRARLAAAEAEVERLRAALADAEARGYARGVDDAVAVLARLRAGREAQVQPCAAAGGHLAALSAKIGELARAEAAVGSLAGGAHTTKETT